MQEQLPKNSRRGSCVVSLIAAAIQQQQAAYSPGVSCTDAPLPPVVGAAPCQLRCVLSCPPNDISQSMCGTTELCRSWLACRPYGWASGILDGVGGSLPPLLNCKPSPHLKSLPALPVRACCMEHWLSDLHTYGEYGAGQVCMYAGLKGSNTCESLSAVLCPGQLEQPIAYPYG